MPTKPPPSRTKRSTAPLRGGEPDVEAKTTPRAPRSASGVSWAIRSSTMTRRPRSERRKACSAGIESWWKPAVSETTRTAGGGASAYMCSIRLAIDGRRRERVPALPAPARRAAERAGAPPHLRGALQGDDRAVPGERCRVRHRLAVRRGAEGHGLRGPGRPRPRALRRRPALHRLRRHAPVPARRAPGRPRVPGGYGRVPRRPRRVRRRNDRRARAGVLWRARRARDRPQARERRARVDVGLPDGRHGRLRARRQAGPARAALGERPAAARRPAVPRGRQAPGLRRARAGPRPLERQGPLQLGRVRALGGRDLAVDVGLLGPRPRRRTVDALLAALDRGARTLDGGARAGDLLARAAVAPARHVRDGGDTGVALVGEPLALVGDALAS